MRKTTKQKEAFCMKEITTEELLKEIEENHNNSLFEEIFKRR